MFFKQYKPAMAAAALFFSVFCAGCGGSQDEETDQQRWAATINEYADIINAKNLDYDTVNTKDLGIKSYNHGSKLTCPLTKNREFKIKHNANISFTVYIPATPDSIAYINGNLNRPMYVPGDDAIELFTYYKDDNGKLRVLVENYDW